MNVTLNKVKTAYNQKPQEQKDAEKKVVAGGGAVAATVSTVNKAKKARALATVGDIDKFSRGMTTATKASEAAVNAVKDTTTLWSKICNSAKWAKDAVMKWGDKFTNSRFIKPIIKSPVYKGFAGAIGLGIGLVTLIAGVAEIAKATVKPFEKLQPKAE